MSDSVPLTGYEHLRLNPSTATSHLTFHNPWPGESPATTAARVLDCLRGIKRHRGKSGWYGHDRHGLYTGYGPIPELIYAIALDGMTRGVTRRVSERSNDMHCGACGPLSATAPNRHAARAKGLGIARIPAGKRQLVSASAAEALIKVWAKVLNVAGDAGVDRAYTAVQLALGHPNAMPRYAGMTPELVDMWVSAALSGDTAGLSDADAKAATRLRSDGGWKRALRRIDREKLGYGLAEVLRPDLDAIEAEMKLEDAMLLEPVMNLGQSIPSPV